MKNMKEWQGVVQRAYRTKGELQGKIKAGEQISAEEQRRLQAAKSLARKYDFSGRRKRRI